MFDPYVWSHVDGTLYIARESYLLTKQRELEEKSELSGFWSAAIVIRTGAFNLRRLEPLGRA